MHISMKTNDSTPTQTIGRSTTTLKTAMKKISQSLALMMIMALMVPMFAFANENTTTADASLAATVNGSVYEDTYSVGEDVYETNFEDLASHWAKADIELLVHHGIVSGATETEFQPNRSITRAEFAALIVRALELDPTASTVEFTDVDSSAWYADTVTAATYAGIIGGYEDSTFRPNATITREELAAMVVRALNFVDVDAAVTADEEAELLASFTDADQIVWAHNEIAVALNAGLINGVTDETIGASSEATRAQAAVILKRFLDLANLL
jgi:hypothetical protein